MVTITINNCIYKTHPIYDLYAGSKDGYVIHIVKQKPNFGNRMSNGYIACQVRRHGQSGFKNYLVHKFIYECFNGVIPNGMQVDHKDDNRENNKLCNLQLLTPSENTKKSIKNRKIFNTHENRKSVKSTNMKTKEVLYFYSMYSTEQHLDICHQSIQYVCDGLTKTAKSKKDNHWYKFEYVEKNLPVNYIKSKNISLKRVSDEDKRKHRLDWWNKEYKCGKCGTVTKNNSKYRHNKKCHSQQ